MDQILKKWNYEQCLSSKTDWIRYFGEYIELVDLILKKAEQSKVTVISLPTLFLIRHTIELGYKINLSCLNVQFNTSGSSAHILSTLHEKFKTGVESILQKHQIENKIQKEITKRIKSLSKFKETFDKLDERSYAFRYPDPPKNKTELFKKNDTINISKIIPAYESAKITLMYTTDVLADCIENK